MDAALKSASIITPPPRLAWTPNLLLDCREGSSPQVLYDRSGLNNHGQLGSTTGSDTTDPAYNPLGWLDFDGVDDFCQIPDHASLNFGTQDFSLLALVYPTAAAAQFILGHDGGGGVGAWEHRWATSQFVSRIALVQVASASGLPPNAWYCAEFSFDRDGVGKCFLNGAQSGASVDISSVASQDVTFTSPVFVGKRSAGSFFKGRVAFAAVAKGYASTAADAAYNYAVLKRVKGLP